MEYKIEIREIEGIRAAFVRYSGPILEANRIFPTVFKSIRGKTNGAPFFNYLAMDAQTKTGDMELCVPTAENPGGQNVSVQEFPPVKAICTAHIGPYDTLYKAYEAIDAYALEHCISLVPPFREVFIKGPGMFLKGNPNAYITEIIFPIKE